MKWLGKFPDPFLVEIAGQPAALRRAAAALRAQRRTLEALAGTRGAPVVFTGMGSSYDACYPAVNELAARGVPALHIDTAELLHFRTSVLSPSTVLIVVSQSGESAEVVALTAALGDRSGRPVVVSVTNGIANTLAAEADLLLDTRAGRETGPSTMTFASSIAQLAAVARTLGGEDPDTAVGSVQAAAGRAAEAVEKLVNDQGTGQRLADMVRDRNVIALLGRGPARAAAEMGALTLKESGVMAESFAAASFRHGPLELAGPDLAAIVLATEPQTRALDLGLAAELIGTGSAVAVLAPGGEAPEGAVGIAVQDIDRLLAPAVSIVPIQLLAWKLAEEVGRIPGVYTRASKVTTHE